MYSYTRHHVGLHIALSNSRCRGALLSIHYSHRGLQIIKKVLRFNLRGCNFSKFSGGHACVYFAHNDQAYVYISQPAYW